MSGPRRRRRRPWWFFPVLVALGVLLPVLLIGPALPERPLLELEPVLDGLAEPVGVVGDPSDATVLYVLERAGRIRQVRDGMLSRTDVLDISADVTVEGLEQGLLGMALHPDFARNERAFIYYTDVRERMVLEELRIGTDGLAEPGSRRVLLAIPDPNPYHNGGQLAFGPDGMLYIGVGDGGLLEGGWRDGRDPASLLGKILRIDVDVDAARDGDPVYGIPDDNPFVGVEGARPEVWAIGLRNPWRFAFDEESGDLWIADVGQLKWEEVNRIPWREAGGANFGWNLYEGRQCFERESCDPAGVTFPILVYPHDGANCAVVGGPVYRGPEGRLAGQYLVGDYCSGYIWTVAPGEAELELQLDTGLLITSFGEGADGTVYVTGQGGELMAVVAGD